MVLVIVAVVAIVILGFVGLAIDSAHVQGAAQQLQAASNAAALAGAARLMGESSALGGTYPLTRAAAVGVGSQNTAAGAAVAFDANAGNSDSGDVVVGLWDTGAKTFTATTVSPNAVKVVARRTDGSTAGSLSLVFGGLFGAAAGDVSRTSIAMCGSSSTPRIIVLHPSAASLTMDGTSSINASGGSIHVNSSNSCGIKLTGTANLQSDQTSVHGHACSGGSSAIGGLEEGADVLPDPLAWILPTVADWTALESSLNMPAGASGKISASGSFAPGYYPQGLGLVSGDSATLNPGTYMFGDSFSMTGSATVTGTNVTILLDSGVKLSVGGGGSLVLTPPASGSFRGLTLMCHRSTTSSTAVSLGGNGLLSCEGSFYVPSGGVSLGGVGAGGGFGQFVCNTLDASGTSKITGLHTVPPTGGSASVHLVH